MAITRHRIITNVIIVLYSILITLSLDSRSGFYVIRG